jgi:hypothetical protein
MSTLSLPGRSRAFLLIASLLAASASGQGLAAAVAQVRQLPLTHSPDVLLYGTASGIPGTHARAQVFGTPRPGATIELQLVGARPNVDATFCVGHAAADQQVPGLGRVLVDTAGAQTYATTTDGTGRATWSLTLPATAHAGDELFVQCGTLDSQAATPVWEMSSACYFELGNAARPIGMCSHLAGTVTVARGAQSATAPLSGICSAEWRVGTNGTALGSIAVHTSTASVAFDGAAITNLRVQPGVNDDDVAWQPTDFLQLTAAADEFLLSFAAQGVDYGPYVVAGALTKALDAVTLVLGPVPTTGANPLAGATLTLQATESLVDPEYFTEIAAVGLTNGSFAQAVAITPRQVNDRFASSATRFAALLAARGGDTSLFTASMPTYAQFVAGEAASLQVLTDGLAATTADMHVLIGNGQIVFFDGSVSWVLSKLAALLGIEAFVDGFNEAVLEECGDLLKELGEQIDAGDYSGAAKTMAKILDKLTSKGFAKRLAGKIGAEAAGKILAKIAARCVPFIGWAIFAAELIWALAEQAFD